MASNLHKFYYRDYYRTVDFSKIFKNQKDNGKKEKPETPNSELLNMASSGYLTEAKAAFEEINRDYINAGFNLEVLYPGLVTGIGISHEANIKGEFQLGIHLDYTTGLPVIYGSTVKGVLRSAFKEENLLDVLSCLLVKPVEKKTGNKLINIGTIKDKLSGKCSMSELAKDIFGGDNDNNNESCSVYERDIFFDAYVSDLNGCKSMLASDSITPHGADQLKNPIPIPFVRIASGCKILFRFMLVDSEYLSRDEKEILFKSILLAFGIGAKTNVGYGRLKQ